MSKEFTLAPYVVSYGSKSAPALDINARRDAGQATYLRSKGFSVVAYSESFARAGVHDGAALRRTYSTVYADGWLSAQPSLHRIRGCIATLAAVTKSGGVAIADYPQSMRESRIAPNKVAILLKEKFKSVMRVGGGPSSPVWLLKK